MHSQKMNDGMEMRVGRGVENGRASLANNLNNLTIKQISFSVQNEQQLFRPKTLKPVLPTKIYHHGYYKTQGKNRKMLPELAGKPTSQSKTSDEDKGYALKERTFARSAIRNSRNSEILNSLIQILKNDPDASTNSGKTKNQRIKTQPSFLNQFLESREISSVKNSRGPKIIGNEIMMLANNGCKRRLVSQEKTRPKKFYQESLSTNKPGLKKSDAFDQMEMTFYKPGRVNPNPTVTQNPTASEPLNVNLNAYRLQQHNQFIQ